MFNSSRPNPHISLITMSHVSFPDSRAKKVLDKLPVMDAICAKFSNTDVLFQSAVSDIPYRLSKASIGQADIKMALAVFDFDHHNEVGKKSIPLLSWRIDFVERVKALPEGMSNPLYWDTIHGSRLLYLLRNPIPVANADDYHRWSILYGEWVTVLAAHGLMADLSCKDPFRLQRIPFGKRFDCEDETAFIASLPQGKVQVQCESDEGIGYWEPVLGEAALERINADLASLEGKKPKATTRRSTASAQHASGVGLFYHLLKARGLILDGDSGARFYIRCPLKEHASASKGSAVLFPPDKPNGRGYVRCWHNGCAAKTQEDVLAVFSEEEIRAAESAVASGGAPKWTYLNVKLLGLKNGNLTALYDGERIFLHRTQFQLEGDFVARAYGKVKVASDLANRNGWYSASGTVALSDIAQGV